MVSFAAGLAHQAYLGPCPHLRPTPAERTAARKVPVAAGFHVSHPAQENARLQPYCSMGCAPMRSSLGARGSPADGPRLR